jgi:hypothetical protein
MGGSGKYGILVNSRCTEVLRLFSLGEYPKANASPFPAAMPGHSVTGNSDGETQSLVNDEVDGKDCPSPQSFLKRTFRRGVLDLKLEDTT